MVKPVDAAEYQPPRGPDRAAAAFGREMEGARSPEPTPPFPTPTAPPEPTAGNDPTPAPGPLVGPPPVSAASPTAAPEPAPTVQPTPSPAVGEGGEPTVAAPEAVAASPTAAPAGAPGGPAAPGGGGPLQAIGQAINFMMPDSYTYGLILGKNMPVQGVALVTAPTWNHPADFTQTDGTEANSILVNLRAVPSAKVPGWIFPKSFGPGAISGAATFEVESANIGTGASPFSRVEGGIGFVQRVEKPFNPVLPFTIIANARLGKDFATGQEVASINAGVNFGLHTLASRALAGMGGIATLVPGGAPVGAGLGRAAVAVDQTGSKIADWAMLGGGFGYRLEARFTPPDPAKGVPRTFDGLFRKGQELPVPGFVEDAINQELASPLIPGEENVIASLGSRVLANGLDAAGIPPVETWDDGLSPGTRDFLIAAGEIARESLAEAEAMPVPYSPLPVPGLGLAQSVVANTAEALMERNGGVPPWMESLLYPWGASGGPRA